MWSSERGNLRHDVPFISQLSHSFALRDFGPVCLCRGILKLDSDGIIRTGT